jgi:hypothetical protein
MKARTMRAKRSMKERQAGASASTTHADEQLLACLDAELSKLPEKYRDALVLSDLEGKTRQQVALALRIPEGTVASRLATARKLLTARMKRYCPVLSAGALVLTIAHAASANVPVPLVNATVQAAGGTVPAHVAALVQGVLKAMLLTKLKIAAWMAVLSLSVGVAAFGQTFGGGDAKPAPGRLGRPASDEMQVLRLEIEALRLDLKATRERVRVLEDAARPQPQVGTGKPIVPGASTSPPGLPSNYTPLGEASPTPTLQYNANQAERIDREYREKNKREQLQKALPDRDNEAISQIEAAIKSLRNAPTDPQALESLSRALQLLQKKRQPSNAQ